MNIYKRLLIYRKHLTTFNWVFNGGKIMGHDVFGYKDEYGNNKIAYLRRGAGNEQARDIYIALDAAKYDCGCSGCGEIVFFTRNQLENALKKLPSSESHEQERKFVKDLIDNGDKNGAWIGFY